MRKKDPTTKTLILTAMFTFIGFLFISSLQAQDQDLEWHSFENAITLAEQDEKYILVDVWAPWCGWCKKMRSEVYPELPDSLSSRFTWTRLNRDDNESIVRYKNQRISPLRLAQKLNVQSVPAIVFLSSEGEYMLHISGFVEKQKLSSILEEIVVAFTNTSLSTDNKSK